MIRPLYFAPLALLAAGCNSTAVSKDAVLDAPPTTQVAAAPSNPLVGKYKGEIEIPKGKENEPAAAIAQGFAGMLGAMMDLEILPDNKYKLSMMGMPIEGDLTLSGNTITLKPLTLMGMSEEEIKKLPNSMDMKFEKEPMTGIVEEGGQVIRMQGNKPEEGAMVFRRVKEEPAKPVENKVASGDQKYVGQWNASLQAPKRELTEDEKQELQMAQALTKGSELNLRRDYTYHMKLMFEFEGTWSVKGNTLTLNQTKVLGMDTSGADTNEPMELKIEGGGSRLLMSDDVDKGALVFTKS